MPVALVVLAWVKLVLKQKVHWLVAIPAERWMLSATLASVLLLAVPLPIFSTFWRFIGALAINSAITLIGLADTVHSRFFGDVTSIAQISAMWQLPSVSASIFATLRLQDASYFLDIVAGLLVLPKFRFVYVTAFLPDGISTRE